MLGDLLDHMDGMTALGTVLVMVSIAFMVKCQSLQGQANATLASTQHVLTALVASVGELRGTLQLMQAEVRQFRHEMQDLTKVVDFIERPIPYEISDPGPIQPPARPR